MRFKAHLGLYVAGIVTVTWVVAPRPEPTLPGALSTVPFSRHQEPGLPSAWSILRLCWATWHGLLRVDQGL